MYNYMIRSEKQSDENRGCNQDPVRSGSGWPGGLHGGGAAQHIPGAVRQYVHRRSAPADGPRHPEARCAWRLCQCPLPEPAARRNEEVAIRLRSGEYSYVSLESALSEFGVISQIPVGRTTMMTTGRSGEIHSIYDTLDFTHTTRSVRDILSSTLVIKGRPLRFARVETALRDLRQVGRNLDLVDMDVYREILEEQAAAGGSAG